MHKKILAVLFITIFLKQIIVAILVPMWHTPDEQAHFAQVAFFAEFNSMPYYPDDLNNEVLLSERLLGTERDERGNNRFTFNPKYKIEYTSSQIGKYESEIQNMPVSYRRELVKQESANYPPLYYWISASTYKAFYNFDLFTRVWASRFVSVALFMGIVFLSYLIAKLLFARPLYQFVLVGIVGFHPMLSFVGAGVNSDNLMTCLFTGMIYVCLLVVKKGITKGLIFYSLVLFVLLFLTKPQYILSIPLLIFAVLLGSVIHKKTKVLAISTTAIGLIIGISFLAYIFIGNAKLSQLERLIYVQSYYPGHLGDNISLDSALSFLKSSIRHTIKEVIPWYWGVFDWLGVTYERPVHRVINWIMVVSAIGVGVKLAILIRKKSLQLVPLIFLVFITASYFLGITFYNYLFYLSHNFPFGIQGRYYFPVITSQMALLFIGLIVFIPTKYPRFRETLAVILFVGMLILNFISLYTISVTYYSLESLDVFINQLSQYKPEIFKGWAIIILVSLYLVSLTYFLYKLVGLVKSDRKSTPESLFLD